jgi:uncharacterized protein YuzE
MMPQRREVDMKLAYDAKADALHVRFSAENIVDSEETRPGFVLDFYKEGHLVAIEVLNAREQLAPQAIADLQAAE